jgi:plasmanylethanolamine desaturase
MSTAEAMKNDAVPTGARQPQPLEYAAIVGFFALCAVLSYRVVMSCILDGGWIVAAAVVLGFVGSDFMSGLVHWMFDTWGSPQTPVVGKTFIVPFRVHHTDPKDITRHGFVATNGHNCLVSLPILGLALLVPTGEGVLWGAPALAFLVTLCLGVFGTNQFHKWAHEDEVGPFIGWLQRNGLILGKDHHDVHHAAPYADNYCITTGWLNAPLRKIRFFRGMEHLVSAITGWKPRQDDLKAP